MKLGTGKQFMHMEQNRCTQLLDTAEYVEVLTLLVDMVMVKVARDVYADADDAE